MRLPVYVQFLGYLELWNGNVLFLALLAFQIVCQHKLLWLLSIQKPLQQIFYYFGKNFMIAENIELVIINWVYVPIWKQHLEVPWGCPQESIHKIQAAFMSK